MRKNTILLLSLLSLIVLPGVASADCILGGPFDRFSVQDDETVTLFWQGVPLARMEVDCIVNADSTIQLKKNYICSGDDVIVDGSSCNIVSVSAPHEQ